MPFQSALSAGNLNTLRGTSSLRRHYEGATYASVCPNTTVYSARVNQSSFGSSFAQVTYDTGSGTLANVKAGQTILISHTNSQRQAHFVGRIRKTPTSSIFYINETSAAIADNDYIWVIDDYRIWDKLGREVSAVLYNDYDITFRQLLPFVYGLRSAYAGWVTGSALTLSFAPSAVAATSGATISTWSWDVGDGTITVGSSSTQNITATFPAGFRWIKLTVTDSGSRALTFKIPVWAHSAAYPPQLLTAADLQVTNALESGFDATLTAYDGVDTLLDNTLVVFWNGDERYQDGTASLTGDNIAFIGRIRSASDSAQGDERAVITSEARLTLESPLTQLARIEQLPYELLYDTTPTKFGEINNLTIWRAIAYLLSEYSTFLELHSLRFSDTSNTFLAPVRNPAGNILAAVNDFANSINAALQMNASGQAEVVRDARMLTSSERNALVTVGNWTVADLLDISIDRDHVRTMGRLKASGGTFRSAANAYNAYESLAPGVAQDYPEGQAQLDRQILTANLTGPAAQSELNARAGHALAKAQTPDSLQATFHDGYYGVLIAALDQWHTFTLDGSETVSGIVLDTSIRWLCVGVEITHESAPGTKSVRATFTRETSGPPGQTVTYPTSAEVPIVTPQFPPLMPFPAFEIPSDFYLPPDPIGYEIPAILLTPDSQPRGDGNDVLIVTDDLVALSVDYLGACAWIDKMPSSMQGTPRQAVWLPGRKGAYLLTNSATESWLYYAPDIFKGIPAWTESEELDGVYTQIEPVYGTDEVYLYNSNAGELPRIWDDNYWISGPVSVAFSVVNPNITDIKTFDIVAYPGAVGLLIEGTGSGSGPNPQIAYRSTPGVFSVNSGIVGNGTVTIKHIHATTTVTNNGGFTGAGYTRIANVDLTELQTGTPPQVSFTLTGNNTPLSLNVKIYVVVDRAVQPYPTDPVGENAVTAWSTDYGATFEDPRIVGAALGAYGGISVSRLGDKLLAGAAGQVKTATDGDVYANYGNPFVTGAKPSALYIPRYQFNSTSSFNSASSPEFLAASNALTAGSAGLWKFTAGGNTATDITPLISGNYGKANSANGIFMPWFSGSIIAAILQFGSLPRLVVSTNAGSSWNDGGVLTANANYIRMRKTDRQMRQAFFSNGGPAYCPNIRAGSLSVVTKSYPSTLPVKSIEVWSST